MRYRLRSGALLQFSEISVETFRNFRQVSAEQSESGGVLLGRIVRPTNDLIIDIAAVPDKRDSRRRTFFFRRRRAAQELVDEHWNKSDGTTNYLGEWHTHPEPVPTPSCIDKANWHKITRKARYHTPILIFVIVGTSEIRVWEMGPADCSPVSLATVS